MNLLTALIILVVGVVLLSLGLSATDSIPNAWSRLSTGQLTDRTVWMIVIGGVAALVGLIGCFRSNRQS